jgi:hypothetical protein
MKQTDHVTLNFNNYISTTFDTTWNRGLLYKFYNLEFSSNLIKLISSFPSQRKFSVSLEGEISTPRERRAGVPQGSVLSLLCEHIYV